ncbi:HD domain-containing protein [candidate division WWE3 bacterium]|uniref:HD domain-containing protein n=1 Tax=candidate division WWE3 bacterium TaxID=2053526 RepID=A0A7X9E7D7_UNCKA|nr:HD domain-containing protein [candidate division WWE3 bacterium]
MLVFDPNVRCSSLIKTGDYIESYLKDTVNVKRYMDSRYPEGMVSDRLCDHIVRLRLMALHLPMPSEDRKQIDRMIIVHDLPEIVVGDVTAIIKKERSLSTDDEVAVAEKMLNERDFALYSQFSQAEDYLLGNSLVASCDNAIIAKVLDSLEGSMYFHYAISKWAKAGQMQLPPGCSMEYFFGVVLDGFKCKTTIKQETGNLVNELLLSAYKYIENLWVGYEQITPDVIKKRLSMYK